MVFVLLLTSVAVIEYLLHREQLERKQGPEKPPVVPQQVSPGQSLSQSSGQADPASLFSLAEAIERQGRGSALSPGENGPANQEMPAKPADKVTETPR